MNKILTIENGVIFITTFLAVMVSNHVFWRVSKRKSNLVLNFFQKLVQYAIILFGLYVFLSQYPIFDKFLSGLFSNSALLVAVLGFTLQATIKNVIAGAMLLSSDAFKIGDRIRIPKEGITGTIEELTLRHTTVQLATNERAVIPNAIMNDAIVLNNDMTSTVTRYPLIMVISLKSDLALAKEVMRTTILANSNVLHSESLQILVTTVTASTVELKCLVATKDLDTSFEVISDLREAIITAYQEVGII